MLAGENRIAPTFDLAKYPSDPYHMNNHIVESPLGLILPIQPV